MAASWVNTECPPEPGCHLAHMPEVQTESLLVKAHYNLLYTILYHFLIIASFLKNWMSLPKILMPFLGKKKKKKHRKTQDICQLELKSTSPHPGRGGVSWVDRVCSLAHSSPTTRTASFM